MHRSLAARTLGTAAPLIFGLLIAAQPAAAHAAHTSGSPGSYSVIDTETNQSVHCFYPSASHANNDLSKIKIKPPKLYAKNRTSGVDSQWVGWQFSIQHGTTVGSAPAGWTTYYKSSVMKAVAKDNQAASFTTKTWIAGNHINRWWRVKLLMFWYAPGSKTKISGQVNWIVDYYAITYPPNPDTWYPTDCIPGE